MEEESARAIAVDFGVGKTQIQAVLKKKEDITAQFTAGCSSDRKRLTASRRLKWPELDVKVF